jgi:hypothetical protein
MGVKLVMTDKAGKTLEHTPAIVGDVVEVHTRNTAAVGIASQGIVTARIVKADQWAGTGEIINFTNADAKPATRFGIPWAAVQKFIQKAPRLNQ